MVDTIEDKIVGLTVDRELVQFVGELPAFSFFDGLLTGTVGFSLERRLVDATPPDPETGAPISGAALYTFALDLNGPTRFVTLGTDEAGVTVTDGTIGLYLLDAGIESWTAVKGTGLTATLTLPGLGSYGIGPADFTLGKSGPGTTRTLDWQKVGRRVVSTIEDKIVGLTVDREVVSFAGELPSFSFFDGLLTGTVGFSLERRLVDADPETGAPITRCRALHLCA